MAAVRAAAWIVATAVSMAWPRVRRGKVGMALGRYSWTVPTDPFDWLVSFALLAGGSRC
jgi:hypothetical protein